MKKNVKVSRRYAKALMLLAREEQKVDAFRANLALVTKLICESELENALLNPVYLKEQRRGLLTAVLGKLGLEDTMYRFIVFLFDQERLDELDLINETFQDMADAEEGLVRVQIASAVPVTDEVTKKIAAAVMENSGRKVIFEFEEDEALIGGLVARLGDYVYDGSVRTQVNNLRDTLKRDADI